MSSPPTFDIGAVTGIVGAITGPAGCVIGWISYRRSNKSRRSTFDLNSASRCPMFAPTSRRFLPSWNGRGHPEARSVAAMGRGQQSGDNLIWKAELENDLKTVQALACELPDAKETYQRSKPQNLETS